MNQVAAHPGLYEPEQAPPSLNGSRCLACGATFFPPLGIGCERCGSQDLSPVTLAAAGTVHATATVHRHAGKDIEAPFTVAEIVLDDGPLIRGLLTEIIDADVIGRRVAGEWVTTGRDDDGNAVVEPRFRLADGEAGA